MHVELCLSIDPVIIFVANRCLLTSFTRTEMFPDVILFAYEALGWLCLPNREKLLSLHSSCMLLSRKKVSREVVNKGTH